MLSYHWNGFKSMSEHLTMVMFPNQSKLHNSTSTS